jgi:sugar/nucleoside kinase (ribokinase family)
VEGGFELCFLGHYTRDTIVTQAATRVVNGGAFYYGANVAARLGLKTAAVTRLAEEDFGVVKALQELGVTVFARRTPRSTCLRLEYPTSNPDRRVISITGSAGPFTLEEVRGLDTETIVLGGSVRGEIGLELIRELDRREMRIAADVQGFIRINRAGRLENAEWPAMAEVLGLLDVLKTDAVEAEMLTGHSDIRKAAEALRACGPEEVVLTHRDGVLVAVGGEFYQAPFVPKKLVGRSGRGDTCIAAYMTARHSRPPALATVWAAAVTSLKMEADGPFDRDSAAVEELIRREY